MPSTDKLVAELIGTFTLVAAVLGGALISFDALGGGSGILGVAFAVGLAVMVMAYAVGPISGGHFNPAVTLAAFLRGRCDRKDVVPYWIAQFAAAGVAALIVNVALDGRVTGMAAVHPSLRSFVVEFLFTFALCWVVLNVATSKGTMGNSFYGLAIGATVLVGLGLPLGALLGGPIGGLPAPIRTGFYAFGLMALLYLVTEELLVEAHEEKCETPVVTSMFFLGFLVWKAGWISLDSFPLPFKIIEL